VGCGTGRLGDDVASLGAPGGEVVGIDPLPLRIQIAAGKNPGFEASVGRAEDLSRFAKESFDVVYLNSVFHWIADKPRALCEARRVLKPRGRLGVNSANAQRPHQSAALVREAVLEEGLTHSASANALVASYSVGATELERLLREADLDRVRIDEHTFVDTVSGLDELVAWSQSSSFGNFLADLSPSDQARVRKRLERKLEALRTPEGSSSSATWCLPPRDAEPSQPQAAQRHCFQARVDRSGRREILVAHMRVRHGDHRHAGGVRRLHTLGGVFEHQAARGLRA
jgi:trans-aconitate methyltransferase